MNFDKIRKNRAQFLSEEQAKKEREAEEREEKIKREKKEHKENIKREILKQEKEFWKRCTTELETKGKLRVLEISSTYKCLKSHPYSCIDVFYEGSCMCTRDQFIDKFKYNCKIDINSKNEGNYFEITLIE